MMPLFADTILTNGVIRTLDPNNPEVGELAIADGRVVAVGRRSLNLRGPETAVVDLRGEFVMPGLLDVHNHHGIAGQSDLSGVPHSGVTPRWLPASLLT
ncbi:MAG: hypothetical protein NTU93_10885 [Arthrobacter sp.]|nr:hypothetical protein [Arthrobacter sp.]